MISYSEIRKAMKMVDNPREWLNCTAIEKQIAQALELYKDRFEYNDTFEDAIQCLELAGYEIGEC